ncbi:MAG TPA: MoxR family ATPase [Chthonomonadaceae bacterium]|nr:MoxR family ATPase [Chthonomonadaceae bacterium]
MDPQELALRAQRVKDAVETAIMGKSATVELAVSVLLSNGHLLIEDIPGVGKTTLAKALARALGLSFKRIQFTPDLLPSDITGSTVFNQKTSEFEVYHGPVFANIVLADEINRTTPKTQAALLECMEERQVTIEGHGHALPSPFFVIATQNNIELSGTYSLPEAQLDRFSARISIGYPDRAAEMQVLQNQRHARPVDAIPAVASASEILEMQSAVRDVHVDESVLGYILDLVEYTRTLPAVSLGASPRGSLSLLYAAQARAAVQGRTYVRPDDIKALAPSILAHRIIVRPEQRVRGVTPATCVAQALQTVPVPVGVPG